MFESSVKILLIEDDLAEARLLQEVLKSFQLIEYSLVHVKRLQEGIDRLQQNRFDVILLDLTLPDSQGLESLKLLVDHAPKVPIVVLTNTNDDKLAIQAVREGAQDYLIKRHVNVDVLVRSVQYAIERQRASDLLREAKQNLENQVQKRNDELIKAKEINQLQSTLVSMFSHDFRNPLTTVLSCAELLQNKSDLLTEEKKTALFRMIRLASKNMAQLLDEVLLVGKADLGTLECQRTQLDLKSFCAEIVEELQFNANKKHIEILFICRGELTEGVWDQNLLRHILGNLLANAVKYSFEGNRIQFVLIGEEKQVTFRIRDWGIGIPLEEQKHLFEPFHRASNVGRIPGTGLGLAIVQSCVKTCQGQIEINSEVGVGTTVTVTLPLVAS